MAAAQRYRLTEFTLRGGALRTARERYTRQVYQGPGDRLERVRRQDDPLREFGMRWTWVVSRPTDGSRMVDPR
ncbi:MAG: hypothetical protein NT029_01045 [Armatimonadetes bacterium]|nr:hypothetical protein [Armatimonadota bacterium]